MSLLSEAMDECMLLDKVTSSDGYGGTKTSYVGGATFWAAVVFDTSMQARVAEKQGVTSLYTVTTAKNTTLEYHDVFRRKKDGKIFRVTSDGDDKASPASSSLDMRQCTAEEFTLALGG